MRDTAGRQEAPGTIRSATSAARRRALLTTLLIAATACGGGGSGPAATPTPAVTPGPTPTAVAAALDLLRLAPDFLLLGGGPENLRPALSRDGGVVAYPQQDALEFAYEDPFFPGFFRTGYVYCARAFAWRDGGPPVALDPDPGCPFPESTDARSGDSWPVALDAVGAIALVNRVMSAKTPYATFGFADAEGGWDEVAWPIGHPLAARVPNVHGNDLTPDGTTLVGSAWLERPWPGWTDSDARPWRWVRGSGAPEWLPAGADAIESALLVSDDAGVIVGCCDDDASGRRALPVVWYGGAPPEVLPALDGGNEYGERCNAEDLSGDGRVVVGSCDVHAVRWVDGVPSEIAIPGEPSSDDVVSSVAVAVSVDGTLVLGRTTAVGLEQGWLWSESDGLRSVRDVLLAAGIDPGERTSEGRELFAPMAFAREGKVLVGRGRSGVGSSYFEFLYRATLP